MATQTYLLSEGDHRVTNAGCQKSNFPPTSVSSHGWAHNQIDLRPVSRRKCPKVIYRCINMCEGALRT